MIILMTNESVTENTLFFTCNNATMIKESTIRDFLKVYKREFHDMPRHFCVWGFEKRKQCFKNLARLWLCFDFTHKLRKCSTYLRPRWFWEIVLKWLRYLGTVPNLGMPQHARMLSALQSYMLREVRMWAMTPVSMLVLQNADCYVHYSSLPLHSAAAPPPDMLPSSRWRCATLLTVYLS